METIIKVQPEELTYALVDKIKAFMKSNRNFEIVITLKEKERPVREYLFEEPQAEYVTKLNQSVDDIENDRNLVSFTVEEFEKLAASLSKK